jgi:hypothetical protein
VYFIQILVFTKQGDTLFYFLQDLAFLPLQILIVTLIVNQILVNQEKRVKLKKLNMVISTFFVQSGTDIIGLMSSFNGSSGLLSEALRISAKWNAGDFKSGESSIRNFEYDIDSRKNNLQGLKVLLNNNRPFILTLLENPNLLEHDTFTDMLWAVFHITDELTYRDDFESLPGSDLNHLSIDIERAYRLLLLEWLQYMRHLKSDYPYLFSLAVRRNPFDSDASVIIKM